MSVETADFDGASRGWRRITRHPALMEYWRLAALVVAVNALIAWAGWTEWQWGSPSEPRLDALSAMALANLSLGILIRQQRIVNALFWLATRIPTSWPLWIRWSAGKVFHFGGLHMAGGIMGTLWFGALLAGMVQNHLAGTGAPSELALGLTAAILALLLLIILTALGPVRARYHNLFERTHRFAGWSVLALFWAQTAVLALEAGVPLIETPGAWVIALLTLSIVSPWLTLRRVPVTVEKPSDHVVAVRFEYGETPFAGSSNAISLNPLTEWHAFANIPTPGESGYRLVISRAGDWTGRFIDAPPSHVWVKGITTSGVARIETLFRRVVYVATGSGIGPVLPHLLQDRVPSHLIWSTRDPRRTYGDALVDEILAARPGALIWDTTERSKPDLSALALQAVRDFDAEAVIVIANQSLTRRVVHDVESQGIPAFGAIWDS